MYSNFVLRKEYKTSLLQAYCPFSFIVIPLARTVGKTYVELELMVIMRDKDDIISRIYYDTRCVCYDKNHSEYIQSLHWRCSADDILTYNPAVFNNTEDIPA